MLECLGVVDKIYPKDSIIFSVGSEVTSIGIMLKGSAHIIKEDIEGNRNIVAELLPEIYLERCLHVLDYIKVMSQ